MRRSAAAAVLVLMGKALFSQVVTDLTPERIKDAIAFGQGAYEHDFTALLIQKVGKDTLVCGAVATPFMRTAAAAFNAKKRDEAFGPAKVTREATDPTVAVNAFAQVSGVRGGDKFKEVRRVKLVVLAPIGSEDLATVTRPVKSIPKDEAYKNALGVSVQGRAVMAVFPVSAIRPGLEARIVYEEGSECRAPINPALR